MITFQEFLAQEGVVQKMSLHDLRKHVEKKGWTLERSGNHLVYSHPASRERIAIPHGRGDASPGIIRKALAVAGS